MGSWYFLSVMISYMSLFFSTSIILDLYYVLKNPFSSQESRIKWMKVASITAAIFLSVLGLIITLYQDPTYAILNLYLFMFIAGCNMILGIVIMIFVVMTFRTKGMSKDINKSI